ncbi:MAG: ATP-binding cassette domain-containing protein [Candidatus Izemoplasmatales bacterium]
MINSIINKLRKKINHLLRVYFTRILVKLYKKRKFIQNEIDYKDAQFAVAKKLPTKEEKEKIIERIAKKEKKIDNSIAKYKNKRDNLSKLMIKRLDEKLKELDSQNQEEEKQIELLKSEKAKLEINSSNKETLKRIESLNRKINKKETLISDNKRMISIQASRKEVEENSDIHLSLSHLTMKFGGLKAVDDLSFDVKKGEIFGLIGPNGAGKTTVFNCITQFYKPNEGNIFFNDQNDETNSLLDFKVHEIINLGIVRTFQNVELVWELSVLDNLLVGAHSMYQSGFFSQLFHLPKLRYEEKVLKTKALDILKELGLTQYKDLLPYGLPYGVLKKIELARTLMTKPNLIILDEPAAGLNDSETQELGNTIKSLRDRFNLTIFLVEHDMGLVMDICDTVCAISFGKKLAIGTPQEIQKNALVKEAYLGGE